MRIRYYIALFTCRCIYLFMRLLGKSATNFPGVIAYKICPKFLSYVKKPKVLIGVTGTNGKTSTCNILIDFFKSQGLSVVNNSIGSNLRSGVISAFIGYFGKADVAILEVDELASYQILPYLDFDYLIVTNLFRDSIKRNAHVQYIFSRLDSSIKKNFKLILNSDDLISSQLGKSNKKIFFSVSEFKEDKCESNSLINDATYCPVCLSKLTYDYIKYHHIGHARCDVCGFTNSKSDYVVNKTRKDLIFINNIEYPMIGSGTTCYYNEAAIVSLLKELGYDDIVISNAFKNIKVTDIRLKRDKVGNTEVIKIAAKGQNAVSASRVFDQIRKEKGKKQIILITDDERDAKEGETSSWLYEADFEYLNNKNISKIIIGGNRRFDSKLRLLLAGVSNKIIFTTPKEGDTYNYIDYMNADKIYIVHDTYNNKTAFKLMDDIKRKLGGI